MTGSGGSAATGRGTEGVSPGREALTGAAGPAAARAG